MRKRDNRILTLMSQMETSMSGLSKTESAFFKTVETETACFTSLFMFRLCVFKISLMCVDQIACAHVQNFVVSLDFHIQNFRSSSDFHSYFRFRAYKFRFLCVHLFFARSFEECFCNKFCRFIITITCIQVETLMRSRLDKLQRLD